MRILKAILVAIIAIAGVPAIEPSVVFDLVMAAAKMLL